MNEIEEFLKRAAAMRARQQGSAPAPPRQAPPAAPAPPQRTTPLAPLSSRLQSDLVEDAEVIDAEEISGSDVSQHVTRYLDSGSFRERSSHLGETIKGADEVIESHLHETFEHRLGQLGATTARAEDSTLDADETAAKAALVKPTTFDLRSLLRSPQNLRNAIILSEVLNPPCDRW